MNYLNIAYNEAYKAYLNNEIPVGLVVVKNNIIIYKTYNKTNLLNNPIAHCEYLSILYLKQNNLLENNLEFYITLEPCIMCYYLLERINAKIYYGALNKIFGISNLISIGEYIPNNKCIKILQKFYKQENKNAPLEKRKIKK